MSLNAKGQEALPLPQIDVNVVAGFIKRILSSLGVTVFRPSIDNKNGNGRIIYPEADALFKTKGEETIRVLETLTAMGVLRRMLLEVVKVCPQCRSPSIDLKGRCPSCNTEILIQYYGGDKLVCPSCGARFDGSPVLLTCKNCNSSFTPHSWREAPLYMFVVAGPANDSKTVLEEQITKGKVPDNLSLEIVRVIDAFAERLDKVIEEYFKAKPMYQVSQSTSVQRQGDITQVQLAPHLAKTYQVVRSKGRVTAVDVSVETGRSRPLESVYLNQLVALGLVSKQRAGRKLYFSVKAQ